MKIDIETIKHEDQRYDTVGDWQFDKKHLITNNPVPIFGEKLIIKVSDLGDERMNCLIAIHELIEALLCRFHEPEITTEMVDQFDMSHEDLLEPGESREAPYHEQHMRASMVERNLAQEFGVNWSDYERRINTL